MKRTFATTLEDALSVLKELYAERPSPWSHGSTYSEDLFASLQDGLEEVQSYIEEARSLLKAMESVYVQKLEDRLNDPEVYPGCVGFANR